MANSTDFTAILSDITSSDPRFKIVDLSKAGVVEGELPGILKPDILLTRMFHADSAAPVLGSLEARITHILNMLGVPAHIKGFHYARKAIEATTENSEIIASVTKILYPYVAKTYSTTPSRVERAIRHAIEIVGDRCNTEIFQTIFGYLINCENRRPTNSEFIAGIADYLRMQSLDE